MEKHTVGGELQIEGAKRWGFPTCLLLEAKLQVIRWTHGGTLMDQHRRSQSFTTLSESPKKRGSNWTINYLNR
jgi:hypothetical protein